MLLTLLAYLLSVSTARLVSLASKCDAMASSSAAAILACTLHARRADFMAGALVHWCALALQQAPWCVASATTCVIGGRCGLGEWHDSAITRV